MSKSNNTIFNKLDGLVDEYLKHIGSDGESKRFKKLQNFLNNEPKVRLYFICDFKDYNGNVNVIKKIFREVTGTPENFEKLSECINSIYYFTIAHILGINVRVLFHYLLDKNFEEMMKLCTVISYDVPRKDTVNVLRGSSLLCTFVLMIHDSMAHDPKNSCESNYSKNFITFYVSAFLDGKFKNTMNDMSKWLLKNKSLCSGHPCLYGVFDNKLLQAGYFIPLPEIFTDLYFEFK